MDCRYCSVVSQANGEDPIGTAGTVDEWLLVEVPRPWKAELWQEKPEFQPLLQVVEQLASNPMRYFKGRLLAIARQPTDHIREILVCTHANYDLACGRFGYPFYQLLRQKYATESDNLRVWQTNHFGGHQFAPTLIDFPTGQVWGHLKADVLDCLIYRQGDVSQLQPFYRGWTGLGKFEQIASSQSLRIYVLTQQVQNVLLTETLNPADATILGLCKVIPQEYPNLICQNIDLSLPINNVSAQVTVSPVNLQSRLIQPEVISDTTSTDNNYARPNISTTYVAPSNYIETRVAQLMENLLGIAPIGIYDNFFELGGHSLLAIQAVSQLREEFQVELPMRQFLFESPTVAGIAKIIIENQTLTLDDPEAIAALLDQVEQTFNS